MKILSLFLAGLVLNGAQACKRATFENINGTKSNGNSSDDLTGNLPARPILEVTVPSPEIKAGGETMQAKANIKNGPANPEVTWEIKGPADRTDIGSIDADGNYKSPAQTDKEFSVVITAVLKSDPTISASVTIKVIPNTQVFARCTRGNVAFPILANVYQINTTATAIPNFADTTQARKVLTVCMDKYAVAPRNFTEGFPDVPDLVEWFALQTTTTLQIAQEGDYSFQMNSDDGSKLSIDGKLLIDNDGLHQAIGPGPDDSQTVGQKEVIVRLTAGDHPLSLDYFQGPKFRIALELKWKKPGDTTYEYVPREAFK
ncbi:MAG TPA: PA14 domain-containing protein [Oligoflexus sp.]|uniref:PA14 domain-containing protein n=1 Tax=Oligoflexus sp. TaxID=1971216 RepID=UPI002D47964A|nr:PA14 domain-containing protein [Oligoflexus sp.]HYX38542.1 PA14 domain-containing protein [Oligoflexus sp.]